MNKAAAIPEAKPVLDSLVFFTSLPKIGGHSTITLGLVNLLRPSFSRILVIAKEMPGHGFSEEAAQALSASGIEIVFLESGGSNAAALVRLLHMCWPGGAWGRPSLFLSMGMRHLSPLLSFVLRPRKSIYYHITHELDAGTISRLKVYSRFFDVTAFISPATAGAYGKATGQAPPPCLLQPSELEVSGDCLPRTPGPVRFGFVGRLAAAKGAGVLAAFAGSSTCRCELHVAGGGDFGGEFARLQTGHAGRETPVVKYHGSFSPVGREVFYQQFFSLVDYLLVPSQDEREGIPTVILEALQFGVPVLATDCGGTRAFGAEVLQQPVPPPVRLIPIPDFVSTLETAALADPPSLDLRGVCRAYYYERFSDSAIKKSWMNVIESDQSSR